MALVIIHPDYSSRGASNQICESFLRKIKERQGYWHALPREVTSWWKNRADRNNVYSGNYQQIAMAKIALNGGNIKITICGEPVNPVLWS